MKRSEMIQYIIKVVYQVTYCDLELDIDEANRLLNKIEESGMLPPYKTKDRQYPECQITHKWEPENET